MGAARGVCEVHTGGQKEAAGLCGLTQRVQLLIQVCSAPVSLQHTSYQTSVSARLVHVIICLQRFEDYRPVSDALKAHALVRLDVPAAAPSKGWRSAAYSIPIRLLRPASVSAGAGATSDPRLECPPS